MEPKLWEEMSKQDQEIYTRIKRTLLLSSNIVREKDDNHRNMYNYIINRDRPEIRQALEEDFMYDGFSLIVDTDYRYVHIKDNNSQSKINQEKMDLKKSLFLLVLWLIYLEREEEATRKKCLVIEGTDFYTRLNAFDIGISPTKTYFDDPFKFYKSYNIIDYKGKPSDDDFKIIIFPTIQFALDPAALSKFIEEKKTEYLSQTIKEESEVEEDMDEIEE